LPAVGSRAMLAGAAAANLMLGLAFAFAAGELGGPRRLRWALAAPLFLATLRVLPAWDFGRLLVGSNVYFGSSRPSGPLLFLHEDVHGGFTSVARDRHGDLELKT